jgi:hypothetical protein
MSIAKPSGQRAFALRRASCSDRCFTLGMYHETFWVAVSAAAPVIALAAIVAFGDQGQSVSRVRQGQLANPWWSYPDQNREWARRIANVGDLRARGAWLLLILGNMILQAVILGFSLSSLASPVNEMPTALAVAAR